MSEAAPAKTTVRFNSCKTSAAISMNFTKRWMHFSGDCRSIHAMIGRFEKSRLDTTVPLVVLTLLMIRDHIVFGKCKRNSSGVLPLLAKLFMSCLSGGRTILIGILGFCGTIVFCSLFCNKADSC
jgi:hypothetical protein